MEELLLYNGEYLRQYVQEMLSDIKKERFLSENLHQYISSPNDRKVCCLYGLRRTGKTIMMMQEIRKLDDYEKSLYIECENGSSVMQIRKAIESYPNVKYVFIDEATKAQNFIGASSVFANRYAGQGIKIVLAGTDSLGFFIAGCDELYDRAHYLHTTYIPFKEYNYLIEKGVMDYIKYGGTLSKENVFYNRDTTNKYSNSAIVYNIIHSLKNWDFGRNYGVLKELADNNELESFINKVIEYNNRCFTEKIINEAFFSHDLGSLVDLISKSESDTIDTEIIYPSGNSERAVKEREDITNRIRTFLHIKDSSILANEKSVKAIIDYLKILDVLCEIPDINEDNQKEYLFTQPGMRYSQASDLMQALVTYESFEEGYSVSEKDAIFEKLEQDICGRLLEDIVLYHTLYAVKRFDDHFLVSKYEQKTEGKEFDMFVANLTKKEAFVVEIKLSNKVNKHQTKHLTNSDFCKKFEKDIGVIIKNKIVLYNGETTFNPYNEEKNENKVLYLNTEEYLSDIEKFVQELSHQSPSKFFDSLNTENIENIDFEGTFQNYNQHIVPFE